MLNKGGLPTEHQHYGANHGQAIELYRDAICVKQDDHILPYDVTIMFIRTEFPPSLSIDPDL